MRRARPARRPRPEPRSGRPELEPPGGVCPAAGRLDEPADRGAGASSVCATGMPPSSARTMSMEAGKGDTVSVQPRSPDVGRRTGSANTCRPPACARPCSRSAIEGKSGSSPIMLLMPLGL
jgi:hypothetical protein